jgi:hypothetical protein
MKTYNIVTIPGQRVIGEQLLMTLTAKDDRQAIDRARKELKKSHDWRTGILTHIVAVQIASSVINY